MSKLPRIQENHKMPFEHLNHTADVQLHAWGSSLQEALEQVVVCMFQYITDVDTVEPTQEYTIQVSGQFI